jgi:predicted transposase/invertase (TIGR01784 family)
MRFNDTDDLIDIRYDNVFKAVFTRSTDTSRGALSRLVSVLIDRKVSITTITANEPPVDSLQDRQIRFDINCKTESGEPVNVEMSLNPASFEPVRLEYHAGKLFTGQEIRGTGRSYNDLKDAYQIAILAKERFFLDEEIYHCFEYYDPSRKVSLGGKSRIITLELSKLDKVVEKPAKAMSGPEQWGIYFRYLTDKRKREKINEIIECEEGIAMASEVLLSVSRDEIERARLNSELKYELDTQSRITYARQQGLQEGELKGKLEGELKGKLEIAKSALKMGMSVEDIIRLTGLTHEEIVSVK